MVFLAALPISTAFANVMLLILAVTALLQGKSMRHTIVKRLQTKFAVVAVLFVAWNALSLLWSQDVAAGIEGLKAQRLLLLPLFWPHGASTNWRFGLLLGTALAGSASVLASAGLVLPGVEVFDGRVVPFQHPIVLGVLCAAGLVLALDAWSMCLPRYRLIIAAAVVLTLFALLLSGSRTGLLATLAALPISLVMLHRRVRIAALAGVALAVPVGLWQHDILEDRWSDAWQELGQWRESPETSVGWRVARWMRLGRWGSNALGLVRATGGSVGGPGGSSRSGPVRRFSSEREGRSTCTTVGPTLCANWSGWGVLLMGFCGGAASVILRPESIHQSSGLGLLAVWGVLGLFDAGLGTGVTLAILALAVAGRERLK